MVLERHWPSVAHISKHATFPSLHITDCCLVFQAQCNIAPAVRTRTRNVKHMCAIFVQLCRCTAGRCVVDQTSFVGWSMSDPFRWKAQAYITQQPWLRFVGPGSFVGLGHMF